MSYASTRQDDRYVLTADNKPLLTPRGNAVETAHSPLADRLIKHLERFGGKASSPVSIAAFHYVYLDFFRDTPRPLLEEAVLEGLAPSNDWTARCPSPAPEYTMRWISLFGSSETRREAQRWVTILTPMQLCAATVLGRSVESVIVPFLVATKVQKRFLKSYAKDVAQEFSYVNPRDMLEYFVNFLFYYHCGDGDEQRGS